MSPNECVWTGIHHDAHFNVFSKLVMHLNTSLQLWRLVHKSLRATVEQASKVNFFSWFHFCSPVHTSLSPSPMETWNMWDSLLVLASSETSALLWCNCLIDCVWNLWRFHPSIHPFSIITPPALWLASPAWLHPARVSFILFSKSIWKVWQIQPLLKRWEDNSTIDWLLMSGCSSVSLIGETVAALLNESSAPLIAASERPQCHQSLSPHSFVRCSDPF